MPKLSLFKQKPLPKPDNEIVHDANDVFSTSPESKQESKMLPLEEQQKRKLSGGKYR